MVGSYGKEHVGGAEQEKVMYAAGGGMTETTMTNMGQRIEEKRMHYKGQVSS